MKTSGFTEDITKEMSHADPMPVENGFGHLSQCYISISGHTRLFTGTRYGKRYMLKCLKTDFLYTPIYRQALSKEFEIGQQLEHPFICRTIGMEEVEPLGTTIVMEYVDGDSLLTLLHKHLLTTDLAHKITHQLMDALEYMHNKQMIHRDLKPANIMVTHNGQNVKLIDFGLSDSDSFTVLKLPAGTSGYIAPEQLMPGAKSEPKADIYSLGMVIRDMAEETGDKELLRIAEICTNRNSQERPQSIAALREAISASTSTHRPAVTLLSVLIALLLIIIGFTYYQRHLQAAAAETQESAASDSTSQDGNTVLDYQLWGKQGE